MSTMSDLHLLAEDREEAVLRLAELAGILRDVRRPQARQGVGASLDETVRPLVVHDPAGEQDQVLARPSGTRRYLDAVGEHHRVTRRRPDALEGEGVRPAGGVYTTE